MLVEITDLTFCYEPEGRRVISDANLAIDEGTLALVVGRTGCGKSTLLGTFNGLVPRFTGGVLHGSVRVAGLETSNHDARDMAEHVGYVGQEPSKGFVADLVEDEIAYAMEQLGIAPMRMRKRMEETLDLLGIADLRRRSVTSLSGGQQQRVAIASVLAAQPKLLVLDEPTSALDPTAAAEVFGAITSLVMDAGLTVVLAEHRLERVMKQVDDVIWLKGGTLVEGRPRDLLLRCDVQPPLARLAQSLGWENTALSVREARWMLAHEEPIDIRPAPQPTPGETLLSARGVSVRYGPVVAVDDVDLELRAGEVTALMGRNGSGKSSLMWALQGGLKSSGSVEVVGEDPRKASAKQARKLVALVPQTASDMLYMPTVAWELRRSDTDSEVSHGTTARLLERFAPSIDFDANPHDLSCGQQLALVLAIQLTSGAKVLLMDEPTRGLDYDLKDQLALILREIAQDGCAVMISTHDVEFAAAASDRMIIMGDAELVADGPTADLAVNSPAYAPQISRCFSPRLVLSQDQLVVGGA